MQPQDDLTYKFIQLWIALAVGAIAVTIDVANRCTVFIIISWILLAVSACIGFFAHSSMIRLYDLLRVAESVNEKSRVTKKATEDTPESVRKRTRDITSWQFRCGLVGLVFFIIYGFTSI